MPAGLSILTPAYDEGAAVEGVTTERLRSRGEAKATLAAPPPEHTEIFRAPAATLRAIGLRDRPTYA